VTQTIAKAMLLCPGQGAQHVGMGKEWSEASEAARRTFAEADRILGIDLSRLCFEGPQEELNRTDVAQAAIYTASVASYRGVEERGGIGQVAATAGLSLGEFTALHLAGAFGFEDGLKLVRLRGQAMQAAAQATRGSMVALVGAEEGQVQELCERARGDGVLVPANFNCPGQIVISGTEEACGRAVQTAEQMGLRATPLAVAGAFHSPLMQPAADRLAQALEEVAWSVPAVPVLSNVTARPHENDAASIRKRLVEQLTSPVRWSESMSYAVGHLPDTLVELAPGKVLSGLMRRIDRRARVDNVAVPR
jgi:[acyl-carrier-protein] S-malonyltransferase